MTSDSVHIERILFPIDLSEESHRAAPFVKEMAALFRSQIFVLQVIETPATYYMPPDAAGWDAVGNIEDFCLSRKAEVESFIAGEFDGSPVTPDFAEGEPARQIACHAREFKADMIMMPTHGYGTFRRFLLGSVTAKVLHDADCPVWTAVHMKDCCKGLADKPERIVCAVPKDGDATRVVRWANQFGKQLGASVNYVQTFPYHGEVTGHTHGAHRDDVMERVKDQMAKLESEAGIPLQVELREGAPELAVTAFAKEMNADLLIIGRGRIQRPLGRFVGHAYGIIRESRCPVISI